MNKFINATLQLKDKNIVFEDKVEEMIVKNIKSLIYFGKLDVNPQYCPACGCVKQGNSIVKNGSKKSRLTLTKVSGLPAYLDLRKQRYHCRGSKKHIRWRYLCQIKTQISRLFN